MIWLCAFAGFSLRFVLQFNRQRELRRVGSYPAPWRIPNFVILGTQLGPDPGAAFAEEGEGFLAFPLVEERWFDLERIFSFRRLFVDVLGDKHIDSEEHSVWEFVESVQ
jgi:hypothetical protein